MYGYTPYGKQYDDDEEYSASMKLVQELREKLPAYTSDQAQSLQELMRISTLPPMGYRIWRRKAKMRRKRLLVYRPPRVEMK